MKRTLTLLIIALTLMVACKKDSKPDGSDQGGTNTQRGGTNPPLTSVGIKADSVAYTPGQLITLTTDKPITRDTITINLNGSKVILTKINDNQYGFVMPVLAQGSYTLNLTALGVSTNPTITVKSYTTISSPATVINSFTKSFGASLDTLQANSAADTTGTTGVNVAFLKQLQAQINKLLATATDAQKLQVAYFIQNNNISFSDFATPTAFDPAYRVNTVRIPYLNTQSTGKLVTNGLFSNIASAWSSAKTIFVKENIKIAAAVALIGIACIFPPAAAGGIALEAALFGGIGMGYLVTHIDHVAKLGADVYNIAVKDKEFAPEYTNNSSAVKPVIAINSLSVKATNDVLALSTDKPVWLNASGVFRTVLPADATDPEFADLFTQTAKFQETDNLLKTRVAQFKASAGAQADQITGNYKTHTLGARQTEADKTVALDNTYLTISDVSNADITLAVTNDGAKGLKISASNPAKNIKNEVSFNFKINYTQSTINNTVSKIQAATYKPTVDSVALLKAKAWNAYEYYSFDPDTKQQSANIIGNTVTLKGMYVICTYANGTPFCSAWNYYTLGYSACSFTFADTFNVTTSGTSYSESISNSNATDCVAGTQHIETSTTINNSVGSFAAYRVLNGWLETKATATSDWYKSYKIVTLNATDLVLERYSGATQVTAKYNFGNGRYLFIGADATSYTTKPGTENNLSGRIRLK